MTYDLVLIKKEEKKKGKKKSHILYDDQKQTCEFEASLGYIASSSLCDIVKMSPPPKEQFFCLHSFPKSLTQAGYWGLTPVILATWEAEIKKINV
jgi:hypothetical protein